MGGDTRGLSFVAAAAHVGSVDQDGAAPTIPANGLSAEARRGMASATSPSPPSLC